MIIKKVFKITLFSFFIFYSDSIFAQLHFKNYGDTEGEEIIHEYPASVVFNNYGNEELSNHGKQLQFDRNYSQILKQQCINGDFEDVSTLSQYYEFRSLGIRQIVPEGCVTPSLTSDLINPAINDFNSSVTIVNSNVIQFDPGLNTPGRGILVPTVSANGGYQSIKLNVSDGGMDVTTMRRSISITQPLLEYEFSLLLQASNHNPTQQPFFKVNIIANGVTTTVRCIIAQPDCIFARSHDSNDGTTTDKDIFYSGWRCDQINVSDFIGQDIVVEFMVGDCSEGLHFGTVYIDNICNHSCEDAFQGYLRIDELNNDCNALLNTDYEICGLVIPPVNATLTDIDIFISKNGGPFVPISNILPVVNGNNFCISIGTSIFGTVTNSDQYQFKIIAHFSQICNTITVDGSNMVIAGVLFQNCNDCILTLVLQQPGDNLTNTSLPISDRLKEVKVSVTATNFIDIVTGSPNDRVIYKAGEFIELNTDFEVTKGSQFAAYIAECPGTFNYRPRSTAGNESNIGLDKFTSERSVFIYPNPAYDKINIVMPKAMFKKLNVTTVDGKSIAEQSFVSTHKYLADVSKFSKGIYLVTVTTEDGRRFTEKLIKN